MALKIKKQVSGKNIFQTENGYIVFGEEVIECEFCVRIINISNNKEVAFIVVSFDSGNGLNFSKDYTFNIKLNEVNSIKQGYEYLKTLDEFKDAKDV